MRDKRGSAELRRKPEGKEGEQRGNGNDQEELNEPGAIVNRYTALLYESLVEVQKGWKRYKVYEESRIRMCIYTDREHTSVVTVAKRRGKGSRKRRAARSTRSEQVIHRHAYYATADWKIPDQRRTGLERLSYSMRWEIS